MGGGVFVGVLVMLVLIIGIVGVVLVGLRVDDVVVESSDSFFELLVRSVVDAHVVVYRSGVLVGDSLVGSDWVVFDLVVNDSYVVWCGGDGLYEDVVVLRF